MGGMAAQIPISNDPTANDAALVRVRADKLREVTAGHDGTWVAHPGLIPIARKIFDAHMPAQNQLQVARADVHATRDDLIAAPAGTISRAGFLNNIDVCVRYLAAWLDGLGCVPIHHLMEDAATAEISRVQLWQWIHAGDVKLDDGTPIDFALFDVRSAHCRRIPITACQDRRASPKPRLLASSRMPKSLPIFSPRRLRPAGLTAQVQFFTFDRPE